jgi:CRISPR-associated endonuclease/helicase Cas3
MGEEEKIRGRFKEITCFEPYPFQIETWQHVTGGKNVVIAAGTGSGKTESALLPALETGKRIILLYPTKALLHDQLERVVELWCKVKGCNQDSALRHIAVDTGDEDDPSYYSADVILTNLDKFLYRMFGYGKKRFSYLFPYRIIGKNIRSSILIFDEAHAYEETAFAHFWFILKKLTYEQNVQTLLLSATLPDVMIEALRDTNRKFFPRSSKEGDFFEVAEDKEIRTGHICFEGFVSADSAIERAWQTYNQDKRVIMVFRRVIKPKDDKEGEADKTNYTLQKVWERLVGYATNEGRSHEIARYEGGKVVGSILTYHGHQMPFYRQMMLKRLKELDGDRKPYLLLTTSAMEVGVDVSCDIMITDLCEPDSFVQRIGRCARRKGEIGRVSLVQSDPAPPRTATLRDYLKNLSEDTKLDANHKKNLNSLNKPPQLETVHLRLEYVQDLTLYRYIYDFVQENREIWKQGVLITREWEPCIPLVRSEERDGQTYIGGVPEREFWRGAELKEKVLLPLSCAADIAPYCAWVFDTLNAEFYHPQRVPVGGKQGRTLKEALTEAGYEWRSTDENKSQEIYAIGLPLVLLLGGEVAGKVYPDDNIGFVYERQFAKPKKRSPSPLLRVCQVELRKDKGKVNLPLYWYEPVEGGETS